MSYYVFLQDICFSLTDIIFWMFAGGIFFQLNGLNWIRCRYSLIELCEFDIATCTFSLYCMQFIFCVYLAFNSRHV